MNEETKKEAAAGIPARPQRRAGAATPFPKAAKPTHAVRRAGRRVMVYGEGGVGKTSLALKVADGGRVVFADLEQTLYALLGEDAPAGLEAAYPETWEELLALCNRLRAEADAGNAPKAAVIDSLTSAETLLDDYVMRHYTANKGGFGRVDFNEAGNAKPLSSLNELGGGGDSAAKYPAFNALLVLLDALVKRGVSIITVCHAAPTDVADMLNGGQVFRRMEPRLMTTTNGKNSMRLRAVEWMDDVLYMFPERRAAGKDDTTKAEHRTGDVMVAATPDNGYVAKSRTLGGEAVSRDEFDIAQLVK